ncbi:MAG: hypothetical protein COT81_03600 [Candidatus Buchananbacteria bacterium CG10_big_fil_rev_8_21_14_0_10_42_9]|uniref:DUF2391 domain-containing protein n=1 Tax=Candidatus Buchananbacteria bacterium CG10_big_fil_rev_8_21_14_0_10_42_9 TaxID=1974526 RepID=A0A2H0W0V1_9BACT|nr:MAG: hypothetical protein COT81_03600 [Candidatus Buchananbacteria bacterium CG10_big_fil_rev_8_21_14_0_10_42_9]
MSEKLQSRREIVKVAGKLRELTTVKDEAGNILHKALSPLTVKFHPRDFFQVIVGAAIISIPVSYTEEAWRLGQSMPMLNVLILLAISLLFVAAFIYSNSYKGRLKQFGFDFIKRLILTYLISFGVVTLILVLIGQAPWSTDWLLAFKRTVIVGFPASMSGALADTIK